MVNWKTKHAQKEHLVFSEIDKLINAIPKDNTFKIMSGHPYSSRYAAKRVSEMIKSCLTNLCNKLKSIQLKHITEMSKRENTIKYQSEMIQDLQRRIKTAADNNINVQTIARKLGTKGVAKDILASITYLQTEVTKLKVDCSDYEKCIQVLRTKHLSDTEEIRQKITTSNKFAQTLKLENELLIANLAEAKQSLKKSYKFMKSIEDQKIQTQKEKEMLQKELQQKRKSFSNHVIILQSKVSEIEKHKKQISIFKEKLSKQNYKSSEAQQLHLKEIKQLNATKQKVALCLNEQKVLNQTLLAKIKEIAFFDKTVCSQIDINNIALTIQRKLRILEQRMKVVCLERERIKQKLSLNQRNHISFKSVKIISSVKELATRVVKQLQEYKKENVLNEDCTRLNLILKNYACLFKSWFSRKKIPYQNLSVDEPYSKQLSIDNEKKAIEEELKLKQIECIKLEGNNNRLKFNLKHTITLLNEYLDINLDASKMIETTQYADVQNKLEAKTVQERLKRDVLQRIKEDLQNTKKELLETTSKFEKYRKEKESTTICKEEYNTLVLRLKTLEFEKTQLSDRNNILFKQVLAKDSITPNILQTKGTESTPQEISYLLEEMKIEKTPKALQSLKFLLYQQQHSFIKSLTKE